MTVTLESEPTPTEGPPAEAATMPARVLLAALSVGAGAVHLAMAPVHAQESTVEGVLFALSGWAQIGFAVAIVARPGRRWLTAGIVANLAFIAAWAVSRTVGLPFGHGGTEPVGSVDLFTVGLEAATVLVAGVVLVRPRFLGGLHSTALVVASVVPAALLVASTMVIASPSAANHAHDAADAQGVNVAAGAGHDHAGAAHDATGTAAGDGHDHGHDASATPASTGQACDKGFNPASYWQEADMLGLATDGTSHDHGHEAHPTSFPPPSDTLAKLIEKAKSDSEVDAGMVVAGLTKLTDDEYHQWLMSLHGSHDGSGSHGDDNHGHGGHQGPQPWTVLTDQAQCQELSNELAQARAVALSMPTAADAKKAGYVQVTPYVPGIAAHYMNFKYVDGKFDLLHPEMVLYDGNADTSHVVGLSYYIMKNGEDEPTDGFAGPEDHYHRHVGLCVRGTMVVGDTTTTPEECAAIGGVKQNGGAGWMSHAWVVPGCESPWGVFSGANPILDAHLAEVSGSDNGGCAASTIRSRYDLKPGGTSPAPTLPSPPTEQAAGPR